MEEAVSLSGSSTEITSKRVNSLAVVATSIRGGGEKENAFPRTRVSGEDEDENLQSVPRVMFLSRVPSFMSRAGWFRRFCGLYLSRDTINYVL